MGIHELNKNLKKRFPNCYKTIPVEEFKNSSISIDGHNLVFRYLSIARKEIIEKTNLSIEKPDYNLILMKTCQKIFNFIKKFLEYRIIPIFVFDGHNQEGKDKTKLKRYEKTQ